MSRDELFEIYKQQEDIRRKLEEQLEDIQEEDARRRGENVVRQMEELQRQLLREDGVQGAENRGLNIEQELLKLREAVNTKGKENKRESRTNKRFFEGKEGYTPVRKNEESNEILNRGEVPLNISTKIRARKYLSDDKRAG